MIEITEHCYQKCCSLGLSRRPSLNLGSLSTMFSPGKAESVKAKRGINWLKHCFNKVYSFYADWTILLTDMVMKHPIGLPFYL